MASTTSPWSSTGAPTTARPMARSRVHRRRVTRLLDGDRVAELQHHPSDEVEPVQRARRHHEVGRRAHDTARSADPMRQRSAERGVTQRIAVARRRLLQRRRRAPPPGAQREEGGVDVARAQVEPRRDRGHWIGVWPHRRDDRPRLHRRPETAGRLHCPGGAGHDRAAAATPLDEPLRRQPGVGLGHGESGDPELAGERAARRERVTRH
jgi:hypothetical protein